MTGINFQIPTDEPLIVIPKATMKFDKALDNVESMAIRASAGTSVAAITDFGAGELRKLGEGVFGSSPEMNGRSKMKERELSSYLAWKNRGEVYDFDFENNRVPDEKIDEKTRKDYRGRVEEMQEVYPHAKVTVNHAV